MTTSMKSILLAAFSLLSVSAAAEPTGDEIRAAAGRDPHGALALFAEFLALPNDAHYPDDIDRLVAWIEPQFEKRGFTTRRVATAGSPALFAERRVEGAAKTALIYLQADGQPVDAAKWDQESPWKATMKRPLGDGAYEAIPWPARGAAIDPDWRVFARSASDSKGPMAQFLLAIDALDAAGIAPGYNLKVIVDTEEELGSPNLAPAVEANRALLAADFLLVFDGPPHASNAPTVVFGARGITTLTLTTWGPKTPQHSGHFGNFLPNPAHDLALLLASLKDADGRVRIKGFYDGVKIDRATREILAATPDDEAAILARMGQARTDKVAPSLQEALQYPSLNIRGLDALYVGDEARTLIPASATAELDIRTVVESDPERLAALVRGHIEKQGFHVLDRPPTDEERRDHARIATLTHHVAYAAFRSDFDGAPGLVARAGMKRLYGAEPILIRTGGGSIPIAPFVSTLAIPAAIVPSVNIDNNQHAENENIRVGNFLDGVAILASTLAARAE